MSDQHEKLATFLVGSDKAQASQNEIRVALESSDDEAKVHAMQKAIAALLNGEQFPALFITIVRYVLPSENHMVQKLLLLYLVSGKHLYRSSITKKPSKTHFHLSLSLFLSSAGNN